MNNAASIYDYLGQQNLNSMFINRVNEAEVILWAIPAETTILPSTHDTGP